VRYKIRASSKINIIHIILIYVPMDRINIWISNRLRCNIYYVRTSPDGEFPMTHEQHLKFGYFYGANHLS